MDDFPIFRYCVFNVFFRPFSCCRSDLWRRGRGREFFRRESARGPGCEVGHLFEDGGIFCRDVGCLGNVLGEIVELPAALAAVEHEFVDEVFELGDSPCLSRRKRLGWLCGCCGLLLGEGLGWRGGTAAAAKQNTRHGDEKEEQ